MPTVFCYCIFKTVGIEMDKRILVIALVSVILFTIKTKSALADGKLLIFSTPSERVANEKSGSERPFYLVNSTATESFSIPEPVSNLSDFGFANNHVFHIVPMAPTKYAEHVAKSKTSNKRVSQSVNLSANKTRSDKSFPFSESLWNETYRGEIRCDDPQLAHSTKEYVETIINSALKKPIANNGEFLPSSDEPARSFFNNDQTRVIIAWNGKQGSEGKETMIVSSGASCSYRGKRSAALSIIPLPGPPISVARVSPKFFFDLKSMFLARTPAPSAVDVEPGVVTPNRIGSHNIFILHLKDIQDFHNQITRYILHKYNGRAFPFLDSEALRVLEYYFERGFRYFAFDLGEVASNSEKEAIAYTFKSSSVYYPLVINRIGGTEGYSTVDLMIITPGLVKPAKMSTIQRIVIEEKPAFSDDSATLVRNGFVNFPIEEVRGIDKSLDVFDAGTDTLIVRNIQFKKRYNSYVKDFVLVSGGTFVSKNENQTIKAQNPNNDSGASNPKVDDNSKNGNDAASKEEAPQTSTEKSETDKAPEQLQSQNAPAKSEEAPSQDATSASQDAPAPSKQEPKPANSGVDPAEQKGDQEQPTH